MMISIAPPTFGSIWDLANDRGLPRSERRLTAILESLSEGVLTFAPKRGRTLFNSAWRRLLGVGPRFAPIDVAFAYRMLTTSNGHPLSVGEFPLSRVLRGVNVRDFHACVRDKSTKKLRHLIIQGAPMFDESGTVELALFTARDISEEWQALDELALTQERMQAALEGTRSCAWAWESERRRLWLSPGWESLLGYAAGQLSPSLLTLIRLVHREDRTKLFKQLRRPVTEVPSTFESEYRLRHRDGSWIWVLDRGRVVRTGRKEAPLRLSGVRTDITSQKLAETGARKSAARLRQAVETSGMGIWDWSGGRSSWSPELYELLGTEPATPPTTKAFIEIVHPDDRTAVTEYVALLRRGERTRIDADFRLQFPDGAERWLSAAARTAGGRGDDAAYICTFHDVTERKLSEARIRELAERDALTGLPNRSYFQSELQRALKSKCPVGLMLLDLDDFKQVNDTLGHDAGDLLLQTVAGRLKQVMRAGDTLSRLGGDEFAVLLKPPLSAEALNEIAERIFQALREPIFYGNRTLDARGSIGIALAPEHDSTPAGILKCADIALYTAKSVGRGGYVLFASAMRNLMQQHVSALENARAAVRDDRIAPHYQPKVDLVSGTVTGFEALLRVRSRAGRWMLPSSIAPAFDDHEVATAMSDRMVDMVLSDISRWIADAVPFGSVAINAGAPELHRADFAPRLLSRLEAAGIPTSCLEIEVTESVFLGRGNGKIAETLSMLSSAGIRIALDDFGTGFASLSHLRRFRVDVLKIDQSFIRELETDEGDSAIVRALIGLGENLKIEIVAEGIESAGQAALLSQFGCKVAQGFHFAGPMASEAVATFLTQWPTKRAVLEASSFRRGGQ